MTTHTQTDDWTKGHTKSCDMFIELSHSPFKPVDYGAREIARLVYREGYDHRNGEKLADSRLACLMQSAPHDCGDPTCPGVINKRKLEAFEQMREALRGASRLAPNAIIVASKQYPQDSKARAQEKIDRIDMLIYEALTLADAAAKGQPDE